MSVLQHFIKPQPIAGVDLIRNPRARRMGLRVDPVRQRICLVVPKRGSERAAWQFAHIHQDWITKKLSALEQPVPLAHGATIPVFGIDREIVVIPVTRRGTDITLTDTQLIVRTNRAQPHTNIKQFLTQLLSATITPLVAAKATLIDRKPGPVTFRDTHARWGSCAPDRSIMFCWRLIFAPYHVIDYVVAHEVAHLKHMNHSKAFWATCRDLSDDFVAGKHWLHINGNQLLRYGGAQPKTQVPPQV